MNSRVGEVIFVDFPFVDEAKSKKRPAVVLGGTKSRLICAAVTSRKANTPWAVELKRWREAGLKKPSKVRLDNIFTFAPAVCKSIGKIHPHDLKKIQVGFGKLISILGR
jgi:mRNA interferase MazF